MPSVRLCARTCGLVPRHETSVSVAGVASLRAVAALHHSSQCRITSHRSSTGHPSSRDHQPSLATADPDIDIKSLQNTLQAVRETNRASLIERKVDQKRRSNASHTKPRLRYVPAETAADSEPHLRNYFDHLSRHVGGKRNKRGVKKVEIPGISSSRGTSRSNEFTEEKGTCRELTNLWRPTGGQQDLPTRFRLPWLAHLPGTDTWASAVDRLSAEIRAFDRYVAPSEEEQLVTDAALRDLIQAIKYADDNLDVDVIGSRATGIADPLSDLDINVSRPRTPASIASPKSPMDILGLLEKVFRGTHDKIILGFRPVEVVYNLKTAKVPILLCRHKSTGLPIQIQCTPRTYDSTEYVKAFIKEYPTLRSLFKVLKQTLLMRGLTIGSHGGLTSYPLLNMIVAALKFAEGKIHPLDAGRQLLFFLDMYCELDFSAQGISTRPLHFFPKQRSSSQGTPHDLAQDASLVELFPQELAGQRKMSLYRRKTGYLMTLQDPANPLNDVGRSAYMIKDVQATLITIREMMKQAMAEWDRSYLESESSHPPSQPQALLEPCVGADYRIYEQERSDLKALAQRL